MSYFVRTLVIAWIAFTCLAVDAGAQTYSYDAAGRLTQVTYPGGTTIAYAYDAAGNSVSTSVTPTPPSSGGGGGGGGCFIATAAYGSALDPHVATLQRFREEWLRPYLPGRAVIALYERVSPPIAAFIAERPIARAATRVVLAPIVYAAAYPGPAVAILAVFLAAWRLRRRRRAARC